MPITRLNHAVLYVRDVATTREFYEGALGFRTLAYDEGRFAFFQAPGSTNDHDLGTFQVGSGAGPTTAGRSSVGLYHLAWEVDTLGEMQRIAAGLSRRGALVGASDHFSTKALYAQDPDGLEFEVTWVVPKDLLTDELVAKSKGRPAPLDLDRELARYGADTQGGVGISIPTVV